MKSDLIKQGILRTPQRALLHAAGVMKHELEKPFIGIITSFSDTSDNIEIRELERFVEKGIHSGGGYAFIVGVPSSSGIYVSIDEGSRYTLPFRELIADTVESIAETHKFDGLVLLGNNDITLTGMLMGALRVNIPTIVVTAGPMHAGFYGSKRLSLDRDTLEALGKYFKGEFDNNDLNNLELTVCPSAGTSQSLSSTNTMACLIEAMGMSLISCATSLAVSSKKRRICYASGERIVSLIKEEIVPKKILNKEAFENGLRVNSALGGDTNSVLHLIALAKEAGINLPLEILNLISRESSRITDLRPFGEYLMEDIENAGGIPAILSRLKTKLHNTLTVSGVNILDIAENSIVLNDDVIRPINQPFSKEGWLAVLKGNLAPDGSLIRQTDIEIKERRFKGYAKVFLSEELAIKALIENKIQEGDIIVIPYIGPIGGPGMKEIQILPSLLCGMGFEKSVVVITDGRFSGDSKGIYVAHVSPEAAVGGTIAVVQDGDPIEIDIVNKKLDLCVDPSEIKRRLSLWSPPKPKVKRGYLARYIDYVNPASSGATLRK